MPAPSCKAEQGGFTFPCPSQIGKEGKWALKGEFVALLLLREEWEPEKVVEAGMEMLQEVEQGQEWGWDHFNPSPAVGVQPYKHIQAHSLEFSVDMEEQSGMAEPTMDAPAAAGAQSHSPQTKTGV